MSTEYRIPNTGTYENSNTQHSSIRTKEPHGFRMIAFCRAVVLIFSSLFFIASSVVVVSPPSNLPPSSTTNGNDHRHQTLSKKNPTLAINGVSPPADDSGIQTSAGQSNRDLIKRRKRKNKKTNVVDITISRGGDEEEEALKVLEMKRDDAFKMKSPVSKYKTMSAVEQLERIRGRQSVVLRDLLDEEDHDNNEETTSCQIDMAPIRIEIHTDDTITEISWDITDNASKSAVMASGKNEYNLSNTFYVATRCIDSTKCYTLTIYNSSEDGMCCSVGRNSWFKVLYDNRKIMEGADFEPASSSVSFGDGCAPLAKMPKFAGGLPSMLSSTSLTSKTNGVNTFTGTHEELHNYDFYPLMDSPNGNIQQIDGDVSTVAKACRKEITCLGFNSNGWMKSDIKDKNQWVQWTDNELKGLYIKKSCLDNDINDNCEMWASWGECDNNPSYMHWDCEKTCGKCLQPPPIEAILCADNNKIGVRIEIFTDQYPGKTYWSLTDFGKGVILFNSRYENELTLYHEEICVESSACLLFTITDSQSDGSCCLYGKGWYRVVYDDVVVVEGGGFGRIENTIFGNSCPSQSPSLSLAPNSVPSTIPSEVVQPSYAPSQSLFSTSWRLFVSNSVVSIWDVFELEFYEDEGCSEGQKISVDPSRAFSSGHYPSNTYIPDKAFDGHQGTIWGGRRSDGDFWLGMEFDRQVRVGCVKILNGSPLYTPLEVQHKRGSSSSGWFSVKSTICDVPKGWVTIDLVTTDIQEWCASSSPSLSPSPTSSQLPSEVVQSSYAPSQSLFSTSWRLFVPNSGISIWDVFELEFYEDAGCSEGDKISVDPSRAFSSGHYPSNTYIPDKAFDGDQSTLWAGRRSDGYIWLGMEFDRQVRVGCVKILNGSPLYTPLEVQHRRGSTSSGWFSVKSTICDLPQGWVTIDLINTDKEEWCASSSPSLSPSRSNVPSESHVPSRSNVPSESNAPSTSFSPTTTPTTLQDLIAVDKMNRRFFPKNPIIPKTSFRYQPVPNCTSSAGEERIGCLGAVRALKVAPPHWAGRIVHEPPFCASNARKGFNTCDPRIPMTKTGILSTPLHAKSAGRLRRINLPRIGIHDSRTIAVADVDGDGSLDVLIGNIGTHNELHLNRQKNGDLENPLTLPGGEMDTHSINAVDMNGDEIPDIIIGNYHQKNQLLLNNGDGSFATPTDLPGGEMRTRAIAIADFDGDGFNDILFGNDDGEVNQLLFNHQGTTFRDPIAIPGTNWQTYSVAVADMNGDGLVDVLFGNFDANNNILLNYGNGTFSDPIILPGGELSTRSIAVGDVDGDGSVDVVVGNDGQINQLLLNVAGDGLFMNEDLVQLPGHEQKTYAIALADIDGDGSVDIMIGNNGENDQILLNSRGYDAGSFFHDPISPVAENMMTVAIAIADINEDQAVDILTVNRDGGNLLFLNIETSSIYQAFPLPGGGETVTRGITIADINGDGYVDIVFANRLMKNQLLLNRGDGSFGDPVGLPGDPSEINWSIAAADFDGDGSIDLVWNHWLLLNRDNGSFSEEPIELPKLDNYGMPALVAVADVDGDGSIDIVHANPDDRDNLLFLNRGNGTFYDPVILPGGRHDTWKIALADMNGDRSIDMVIANGNHDNLLLLNAGNGTFSENPILLPGGRLNTYGLAVADFNGDGWNDIIFGNDNGEEIIQLLLNNGDGHFNSVIDIPVGSKPFAFAAVDIDGNGSMDILLGSQFGIQEVRNQLLLNKGNGTFFDPIDLPLGDSRTSDIAAADVRNDGTVDIVVGNQVRDNHLIRYIPCPSGGAQIHEASWCFDCPSYMGNPLLAGVQQGSTCRECLPDHMQEEGNGQLCNKCVGAHRKLGEDTCVLCSNGTYYDNTVDRDEYDPLTWYTDSCLTCPPGEFSNSETPAINKCFECRPGTFQPNNASSACNICEAGSFQSKFGQTSCEPCPKGGYCDASDTPGGGFRPCPPGTYNEKIGMDDSSSCIKCPKGSYNEKIGMGDSSSCIKCPKGSYGTVSGATSSESCWACPPGTYNDNVGISDLSSCKECPKGSFGIEIGATACLPCAPGTYSNETGMAQCHLCKEGTFQNIANQTSCNTCKAGTYTEKPGLFQCISCPHRLDSLEGSGSCPFCASGFYLNNSLSDEIDVFNNPSKNCLDCPIFTNSSCPFPNTTLQTLGIPSGFWRASLNTSQLYKCDSITCAGSQSPYYGARDANTMYCTEGHKGPLCQVCNDKSGSYFSRIQGGKCVNCPSNFRLALQGCLIIISFISCIVFAKFAPSRWSTYILTILSSLSVQAKVKILVSFYQIVSSLEVVYGVRISRDLAAWLNVFQYLSLEIFDVIAMPKSCIGSIKQQLIVGAVWPYIIAVVGAVGISVHIICRARKKRSEDNDDGYSSRAGSLIKVVIYRLIKLVVVVLYFTIPTVSRGIFDAIKCRSFKVRDYGEQPFFKSYLLVDLEIECNVESDDEYRSIQGIFWAFFVIWPVLTPLGFLALLMYVSPSIKSKSITALADACRFLWNDYDESVWFWDVIDLWRKILLSGFIMFIDTQEGSEKVMRLVIAAIISTLYLGVLAISRPYKRRHDLYLAFVSSFLLSSCFSAGIILRLCNEDEDDDESGVCNMFVGQTLNSFRASVVVVASVVGMLLITSCFLIVLTITAILAPTVLLASGSNPNLEMSKDCQFHAFISHVWETGQAKTHAITRKLQLYLPTLKIWLDVNDLEETSMLEKHIAEAEVFILYWSAKYFESNNCRREIYAAVRLKKPVVLLYEGDESVLEALRIECLEFCKTCRNDFKCIEPADILGHIFQDPPILWLDQNVFSAAALNRIYSRLLRHLPYYQRKPGELNKGIVVPGELQPLPLKRETNVLVCGENRGSRALAVEIKLSLPEKEFELMNIIDAEEYFQQQVQENEDYIQSSHQATILLLYLNRSFFQATEGILKEIIQSSIEDPNIKIVLVHEQDTKKGGCPFGLFFDVTPQDLIKPPYEIFKSMAIPLYSIGEYRDVSIRQIVHKFEIMKETDIMQISSQDDANIEENLIERNNSQNPSAHMEDYDVSIEENSIDQNHSESSSKGKDECANGEILPNDSLQGMIPLLNKATSTALMKGNF